MVDPFKRHSSKGPAWRLLSRSARTSVIREIEDLLARAKCVRDVSEREVGAVADARGIDLARSLATQRRNLYGRFLEYCLLDCELSEQESEELEHLRALLHLSDRDAGEVHDRVSRSVYGRAIDQVLADHHLDEGEGAFLRRLRGQLRLSESEAAELEREGEARARHRYLERSISYDHVWLASEKTVLELRGSSTEGLEAAVRGALQEATRALPELQVAEVTGIRVTLSDGGIREWHVRLRASMAPEAAADL